MVYFSREDAPNNPEVFVLGRFINERLGVSFNEDDREKAAWAALGRKAASRWAQENPF